MDERKFQKNVVKRWRGNNHIIQVFNDKMAIGVPDTYICQSMPAWVEFKIVHLPIKPSTPVVIHISGAQINWARTFGRADVPVFCLVGVESAGKYVGWTAALMWDDIKKFSPAEVMSGHSKTHFMKYITEGYPLNLEHIIRSSIRTNKPPKLELVK